MNPLLSFDTALSVNGEKRCDVSLSSLYLCRQLSGGFCFLDIDFWYSHEREVVTDDYEPDQASVYLVFMNVVLLSLDVFLVPKKKES